MQQHRKRDLLSEKGDLFEVSSEFKKTKGHLALKDKMKRKPDQFCSECGKRMRSDFSKLTEHCKNKHKGSNKDPEWLKRGALPIQSIYSNFQEFMANPKIML